MDSELPDKQYFKIGEVARITSLNSSVLRFWETEFEILRPMKSHTGQRLYSKQDVQLLLRIKHLLYSEKLTIAGAKNKLAHSRLSEEEQKVVSEYPCDKKQKVLDEIRAELRSLRDSL
jgi:DNA-binding transcriptional MerR regulator